MKRIINDFSYSPEPVRPVPLTYTDVWARFALSTDGSLARSYALELPHTKDDPTYFLRINPRTDDFLTVLKLPPATRAELSRRLASHIEEFEMHASRYLAEFVGQAAQDGLRLTFCFFFNLELDFRGQVPEIRVGVSLTDDGQRGILRDWRVLSNPGASSPVGISTDSHSYPAAWCACVKELGFRFDGPIGDFAIAARDELRAYCRSMAL